MDASEFSALCGQSKRFTKKLLDVLDCYSLPLVREDLIVRALGLRDAQSMIDAIRGKSFRWSSADVRMQFGCLERHHATADSVFYPSNALRSRMLSPPVVPSGDSTQRDESSENSIPVTAHDIDSFLSLVSKTSATIAAVEAAFRLYFPHLMEQKEEGDNNTDESSRGPQLNEAFLSEAALKERRDAAAERTRREEEKSALLDAFKQEVAGIFHLSSVALIVKSRRKSTDPSAEEAKAPAAKATIWRPLSVIGMTRKEWCSLENEEEEEEGRGGGGGGGGAEKKGTGGVAAATRGVTSAEQDKLVLKEILKFVQCGALEQKYGLSIWVTNVPPATLLNDEVSESESESETETEEEEEEEEEEEGEEEAVGEEIMKQLLKDMEEQVVEKEVSGVVEEAIKAIEDEKRKEEEEEMQRKLAEEEAAKGAKGADEPADDGNDYEVKKKKKTPMTEAQRKARERAKQRKKKNEAEQEKKRLAAEAEAAAAQQAVEDRKRARREMLEGRERKRQQAASDEKLAAFAAAVGDGPEAQASASLIQAKLQAMHRGGKGRAVAAEAARLKRAEEASSASAVGVVLVLGPPAVGKATVARRIASEICGAMKRDYAAAFAAGNESGGGGGGGGKEGDVAFPCLSIDEVLREAAAAAADDDDDDDQSLGKRARKAVAQWVKSRSEGSTTSTSTTSTTAEAGGAGDNKGAGADDDGSSSVDGGDGGVGGGGGGGGGWECSVCGRVNDPSVGTCRVCSAARGRSQILGGMIPSDDILLELFQRRIARDDCARGFVLHGFPRSLEQARSLDILLLKRSLSITRSSGTKGGSSSSSSPKKPNGEGDSWNCGICGRDNVSSSVECRVCSAVRGASNGSKPPPPLPPGAQAVTTVLSLQAPLRALEQRACGRWVHEPSGRSYHATNSPPKSLSAQKNDDGGDGAAASSQEEEKGDNEGKEAAPVVPSTENMRDDETGEPLTRLPYDTKYALRDRHNTFRAHAALVPTKHYPRLVTVIDAQSKDQCWIECAAALGLAITEEAEEAEAEAEAEDAEAEGG